MFASRRTPPIRLLLVAALLVPLAACATKRDMRDLQTEFRELNARQEALLRELQRDQRTTRDSVRALSGEFAEHRAQVGGQFRAMEDLILRVQELAGLSQQELAGLRDQMARQRTQGGFEPGFPGGGEVPTGGGGVADDIYEAAMTQLRRGGYTSARLGFEDLIERFPNHRLTPHARYHLADVAAQEGDAEEALRLFQQVGEFHPDSDRVPDALYRVGMIHRDRGETSRAREAFDRVVNTWPDSPAADLARDALRQLR